MKSDLEGRVCLVTGAAQGIGQAIADRLADCGGQVIYTDLNFAGAQQAASRQNDARAERSQIALHLDVTQPETIEAAVTEIIGRYGRIDILVNNAGVNTLAHRVPIDEFPRAEWNRLLDVDLTGVYETTRVVAPVMRRQGAGRIVNIGSVVGLVPLRLQSAFNAAKAAVVHLTKAMALELAADGILVNAVCPGSILTEGTQKLFYGAAGTYHDRVQQMLDHVPLGRPGSVEEIAVGVQFLVDPENTYMTGHILTIDGGWICGYARDF